MTFKIGFLIIPLSLSAIIGIPSFDNWYDGYKAPSFSFLPDPSVSSIPSSSSQISSTVHFSSLPTVKDFFTCSRYGPFSLTNCNNFNATFEYRLNSVSNQTVIERIRIFNSSNSVVAASSKAPIDYIKGTKRSVSFLVPIQDYWSINGLTLKFEIVNSDSSAILKAFSVTFYPPSQKTISGVSLKREQYTSKCLGFYGDGEGMKELKETFDFTTIGDYLGVDYYYRLRLDNNYFLHPNEGLLTTYGANLRFNDDENLFPYYTHQDNGDILIPLSLNKSGNKVTFKYMNNFYLNKKTLQISDTYRSSFVATRDFYLPINGRRKFNNKQLYIDLERVGFDEISTSIPLKYDTSKSLVGVCTDGEYCLVGGNR